MSRSRVAPWWAKEGARVRFSAGDVPPVLIELPGGAVTVSYAELLKHAGGREVGAVSCTSRSFTSVQTGGASAPGRRHLYTGTPSLIHLWPGDELVFEPVKPGGVELVALLACYAGD